MQDEYKLGTMMSCNVPMIEQGQNKIEIVALNPVASMETKTNPSLGDIATCLFCLVYSLANFLIPVT